jgi:septum formation protein
VSTPTDAQAPASPLLILASQSPSRVSILTSSGIAFRQLVSGVDEDAALAAAEQRDGGPLGPSATALELARAKAEAVAALPQAEGHLVLGCDSVFELDGLAYGKPLTPEVAVERITAMSGRTGVLHTGHWLVDRRPGAAAGHGVGASRSAEVSFSRMTPEEVEAYVATGEPLWVAGSFTIEGYGSAFIEGIRGESHTVLGLSVNALRELLSRTDLAITDLWTARA